MNWRDPLDLRSLSPATHRFMVFSVVNVFGWQLVAGQMLPLFARHIEMPKAWVGTLIAFMPLSMLLVLATLPIVERFGPKRVLITAWTLRSLVATLTLAMPFVIVAGADGGVDMRGAWWLLMAATLLFCLTRALGVGGWMPWIHEVVPQAMRGRYFATEMVLFQIMNIVISAATGLLLGQDATLDRYLMIYTFGIFAGFLSVFMMLRIPGGETPPPSSAPKSGMFHAYGKAWRDRDFMRYTLLAGLGLCAVSWAGSVNALYLRDMLGYSDQRIMLLYAIGSLGIALTTRSWGRHADLLGGAQTKFLTLGGFGLSSICFLLAPPVWSEHPTPRWVTLAMASAGLALGMTFSASYWVTASRGMLERLDPESRVGHANIWTVAVAITLGVTPIVAGWIIDTWGLTGFQFCYAVSAILAIWIAAVISRLPSASDEEARALAEASAHLVTPTQPLRAIARVAWISAGLHPLRGTGADRER